MGRIASRTDGLLTEKKRTRFSITWSFPRANVIQFESAVSDASHPV